MLNVYIYTFSIMASNEEEDDDEDEVLTYFKFSKYVKSFILFTFSF